MQQLEFLFFFLLCACAEFKGFTAPPLSASCYCRTSCQSPIPDHSDSIPPFSSFHLSLYLPVLFQVDCLWSSPQFSASPPLLHSFLCAAAPPIVFPQISSTLLLPSVDNVNNPTFNNTLSDSVSALHLCPCGNSTLDWVFHRASQLGCQREACRGGRTQPGSFPTRHGFTLPEGASENLTV